MATRSVKITWETQDTQITDGDKATGFRVTFGLVEKITAITAREVTMDVEPGDPVTGAVALIAGDGTELAPPKIFAATIPPIPTTAAPVPITVNVGLL